MSPQQEEKPERPEPVDVTILGVHVKSTGYPNVIFRLRGLALSPQLRIREINFPFRRVTPHRTTLSQAWKPLKFVWSAFRLAYAHLYILLAYVWHGRPRRLYIPYPSAIVLFCLSLLPKPWRPEYVVADCFISLYDTVITDRKLLSSHSLAARILRLVESRAYRAADRIIVDTDLNASYFMETFGLAPSKIMSLPLSIDADSFQPTPYQLHGDSCTVLFIGTFVPLQGVDTIARAALALESRQNVRFRLIGSGQTADAVSRIFANRHPANLEWITRWMDSENLAREIRSADICLGIFGTGPKTQRVWPLKNYAYMAVGRAIITGDTPQARNMLQQAGTEPFMTVPQGDPAALASAISDLAGDSERRRKYAKNARCYYEKSLSPQTALEQIILQFTHTSNAMMSPHSRNLHP